MEKNELKNELYEAAMELARYASYAEIVGALSYNNKPIRKWCDKIFNLNRQIMAIEDQKDA